MTNTVVVEGENWTGTLELQPTIFGNAGDAADSYDLAFDNVSLEDSSGNEALSRVYDFGSDAVGSLPAGVSYTGAGSFDLAQVQDLDGGPGTGTALNFSGASFSGYTPDQDGAGGQSTNVSVEAGGSTVRLTGNAWKKTAFSGSVDADTVLNFEVNASNTGELIGIGFDTDDEFRTDQRMFVIDGSDTPPVQLIDLVGDHGFPEHQAGDGWVSYTIDVGSFYTGPMQWLTFMADDDNGGAADVRFRNIRVYEA
ncbi:MAG: hypothetical protein AAF800_01225 [Planctomycetota bacterium]